MSSTSGVKRPFRWRHLTRASPSRAQISPLLPLLPRSFSIILKQACKAPVSPVARQQRTNSTLPRYPMATPPLLKQGCRKGCGYLKVVWVARLLSCPQWMTRLRTGDWSCSGCLRGARSVRRPTEFVFPRATGRIASVASSQTSCMHVCMYMNACMHVCIHACLIVCIHVYMYCMYAYMHAFMCMQVCMYLSIY